jgi:hypothetical protein
MDEWCVVHALTEQDLRPHRRADLRQHCEVGGVVQRKRSDGG